MSPQDLPGASSAADSGESPVETEVGSHLPASVSGAPLLPSSDADYLRSLSDDEFRLEASKFLSALRKFESQLQHKVGTFLAEANARWGKSRKDDYTALVEAAAKALGRHPSTLWRWRTDAEKRLGLDPERPRSNQGRIAPPRFTAPAISANSAEPISAPSPPQTVADAGEASPPASPATSADPDTEPPDRGVGTNSAGGAGKDGLASSSAVSLREGKPRPTPPPADSGPSVADLDRALSLIASAPSKLFVNVDSLLLLTARKRLNELAALAPKGNGSLHRAEVTPRFVKKGR